ncbi:MAG: chemotaxis protein CheR [Azoarcus sp.]|jgi:chemotaxis protein methyltransferase CheR|nr:chemotaxis protein CheR [Azoarcus sp.]
MVLPPHSPPPGKSGITSSNAGAPPGSGGKTARPPLASAVAKTLSSIQANSTPQAREFEFTNTDFERICKLIHAHAGIALSPAKQDMVYSRLARRLRACGDHTFAQYLARLERDKKEWETFVNSLTTNLTSFFREAHHFEILAEQLKRITEKRPIKIWCCAASTGEEPYSLAITACEAFASMNPPVQITASDIDTMVLAQGQAGQYRKDRVDRMPPSYLGRYFTRGATDPDIYTVRPELKRLITFQRINLLGPAWSVQGPLDAIFCRNVMIYFDKPTQYGILKRFVPLLRPEGQLYAGHSESFMHAADLLRSRGRTVYVRLDAPPR